MGVLPDINESLNFKDISRVLSNNFSEISKEYMTFITQWLIDSNKVFNDCEKFYILIYLFNKNLEFYNDNLIYFDYETFRQTNKFDVQKINIIDIAKNLSVPKESVRRKIIELEKEKIIQRQKKNIIINKNSINLFDIPNNIKSLSNVLFVIYNICLKFNLVSKKISKEEIVKTLNKNFSFFMLHYFEFIFPWVLNWKKFFDNDLEMCVIWSVIVLNKSVKLKKINNVLNIEDWRYEIGEKPFQGINTMSLAEISGIPRPTVSRKIKKLLRKKVIFIDEYKLIHPVTFYHKKTLAKLQNTTIDNFCKFSSTVFNRLILN